MNTRELATILSVHADELNRGKDTAAQLLLDHPQAAIELEPLFRLAASIQAALVPIKAPISFVGRLRGDLMRYSPEDFVEETPVSGQKALWLGVAAAGSVLSVTGVALLVLRRVRTGRQAATKAV